MADATATALAKHAGQSPADLRALGAQDARLVRPVGCAARPHVRVQRHLAQSSQYDEAGTCPTSSRSMPSSNCPIRGRRRSTRWAAWLQQTLKLDRPARTIRASSVRGRCRGRERGGEWRAAGRCTQPERWMLNFGGPNHVVQVEYWVGNKSVGVRTTAERLRRDADQPAQGHGDAGAVDPADRHAGRQHDLPVDQRRHPVVGNPSPARGSASRSSASPWPPRWHWPSARCSCRRDAVVDRLPSMPPFVEPGPPGPLARAAVDGGAARHPGAGDLLPCRRRLGADAGRAGEADRGRHRADGGPHGAGRSSRPRPRSRIRSRRRRST